MTKGAGVRIGRRLAVIMVCCGVTGGLGAGVPPALGESAPSPSGSSPLGGGLVVPEAQTLDEGQQVLAAEEAKRSSPEAQAEREASATEFANLDPAQARAEAATAFPAEIARQEGGPPPLPAGQRITGFVEPDAAQVEMSGYVGIIQSSAPMATETPAGAYVPVDLSLHEAGGAYEAANPLVPVRIPKHLEEGAQLPDAGISLTPVDDQGASLGGAEGEADGATVDFPNTQTDTDTIVKPSSLGVAVDALLRSAASPETLYYRVGMPQGAVLVHAPGGSGAVAIVKEGAVIARVQAPSAHDAAGTQVPVSMSVSGDVLVVTVHHRSGGFDFPILTDPFVEEWSNIVPGNWNFHEWIGYTHGATTGYLEMRHTGRFIQGDYGEWDEQTQGYTKIYRVYIKGSQWPPEEFEGSSPPLGSWLEIKYPGSEWHAFPFYPFEGGELTLCSNSSCTAEGVSNNNIAVWGITTNKSSQQMEEERLYPEPSFGGELKTVSTAIAQEAGKHSTVKYNTSSNELSLGGTSTVNVFDGTGAWIGPHSGAFEFKAEDGGLGVSQTEVEYHGSGGWEKYGGTNFKNTSACVGIQCHPDEEEVYTYDSLTENGKKPLSEPEAKVRVAANSPMRNSSSSEYGEGEATLKVDAKPPHGITLTGLASKGTELELGEVEGHFKVEASDGEGSVESSGLQSIGVEIDGHEIGRKGGYCSPGPCTGSSEWAINGGELGAGAHVLTVVAIDNAGNLEKKEYELIVHPASPVALGPGSVNPESGDFALEATDVNLSGGMGALQVTRHYDSRNTKEGEQGPLGPQWTIGLSSLASLEVLPDKSVMVIGSDGLTHFSVKAGGGFEAPEGDKNLTLEYEPKTPAYLLKNPAQGTTIEFTLPKGAESWMPTVSRGPVATDTTTDEYATVEVQSGKMIVEPTLELAPHPYATCTLEKMEKGCRALEFKYGKEAKVESGSEWGEYPNRLMEVVAVGYNPSAKEVQTVSVAKYGYDLNGGRLRAEWDPRVSPALKTTYGYDTEGHVTALSPPGQEPWLMHYGVINGDSSTGRVLSVTRPSAATKLWSSGVPVNDTEPWLSSINPVVGTTLSVSSNGLWNNSPLTYAYQWEDCGFENKECVPIVGAVNQSYTPQPRDAGFSLMVEVTAENAGGARTVASVASNAVSMPAPSFASAFGFGVSNGESKLESCTTGCRAGIAGSGSGQFKEPEGVAVDSEGNVWVTDTPDNRVEKFSSSGGFVGAYSPDSMLGPEAVAFNPVNGNIYVSNSGRDRIDELSTSGSLIRSFGEAGSGFGQLNAPDGLAFDSSGDVWVADNGNDRVVEFSAGGTYMNRFGSAGSGNGQFSYPTGVAVCNGALYVSDWGNNRVEKFSTEGQYEAQFGGSGSGNGQFNGPSRIACEPAGNDLYVADKGNNRVQEFTDTGIFIDKFGSAGSEGGQFSTPIGVAVGPGGVVYVADSANYRVQKWTPTYSTNNPVPEPPSAGSNSVSTIEYDVPLEGEGAPQQMGVNAETHKPEPEKWAQKDDPVYATSIFAPDEPMGWPAKDYKRATTYYMDNEAHTVNVASPAGGITTNEYNENNDVTRTLSADNRAAALKEGSKSAEASELLDTKSEYGAEGTQVTETVGPQHTVKLVAGKGGKPEETLARNQAHYYYDEGAPEGETYDLVTKTVDDALTAGGEEFDKRTSVMSYGGQKGLGWKLRKPTSTTTDPTGLDLTKSVEYNETTGNVVETKAPAATSEAVAPPSFAGSFGSEGAGGGQFKRPMSVALDSSGDEWVADKENQRVEELSSSGAFMKALGWGVSNGESKYEICTSGCRAGISGPGAGQFANPWGVAINQSTGNVYVGDSEGNRIEEFKSSGEFVQAFGWGVNDGKSELETCTTSCKGGIAGTGNGQLNHPVGLAVDSQEDIWVTDRNNNRVQEFSSSGAYISQFGSKGSGEGQLSEPEGIAISEGEIYVLDYGNDRVEEFSPTGSYIAKFGTAGSGAGQLKEPQGIAANPNSGNIYVSDTGNERVQEFSPAGKFLVEFGVDGTGKGLMNSPTGLTISPTGELDIADEYNYRIDEWLPPEARSTRLSYSTQFGTLGSGHEQFNDPTSVAVDGHGNIWVSDLSNSRIEELSSSGKYIAAYGTHGSGEDQFSGPRGIAINQSTGNVYVSDGWNNRVEELSSSGAYVRAWGSEGTGNGQFKTPHGITIDSNGNVWVSDYGNSRIQEFSSTGTFIAAYGAYGTENGQFKWPTGIVYADEHIYVADSGNDRVQKLTTAGAYTAQFGGPGDAGGQFKEPANMASDSAGNLYIVDEGNDRVQELTSSGTFLATVGSLGSGEGQLKGPLGVAINAAGGMYVADSANNRIEQWTPANEAVHDTKTIYYTAGAEASVEACRNHPEWVNLPCQTEPAAQPGDGLSLPVTTIAYSMWLQAEKTEETFGTTTRTKKTAFDGAGRPLSTEETSSNDEPLPKVTDAYNTGTGALETQSTTTNGKTRTITRKDNTLGQLIEYTDADGATTKYGYEEGSDDRLEEVTIDGPEGETEREKGKLTYSYNTTTGFMTKLVDSAAGTFTAGGYDVEGKMTSETYPNGMTATLTTNQVGQITSLEYVKTTHCTEHCVWFSDSIMSSIHGETLSQTSTLSKESYTDNSAGSLTEVQETPVGKPCTARLYAYDEESNRTSLTTRTSSNETCPTEGGTTERHIYDEANHLTDEGVTYEPFGNITKLPATDAGQYELTSSFYVDGQVDTQTQNEKTLAYNYDPEGRTRETKTTVKGKAEPTIISHYAAPGEAVAWTSEEGKAWTRNIPSIDGTLTATQTSSGTTTLLLHDLNGNIVATAGPSETETKLLSTYNSTEFGVPSEGKEPPKYAWQGADGITSELVSGTITKDGATYVPLTGRALQTQPVELPTPVNSIPVFTDPQSVLVAETAGSGSAHEIAAFEESQRAAEKAVPSIAIVEAEVNTGSAVASGVKVVSKTMYLSPSAAIALGDAMIFFGKSLELATAEYKVPTWAFRILESMSLKSFDEYGVDLIIAGTTTQTANEATGNDHQVRMTFHGQVGSRGFLWSLEIEGWILT